jgi:hypothetical protein
MDAEWLPPRPWSVEQRGDMLVVGSVDPDGHIDEIVCQFEYGDAVHRPIELARARMIAIAMNSCPYPTWDEIKGLAEDFDYPVSVRG